MLRWYRYKKINQVFHQSIRLGIFLFKLNSVWAKFDQSSKNSYLFRQRSQGNIEKVFSIWILRISNKYEDTRYLLIEITKLEIVKCTSGRLKQLSRKWIIPSSYPQNIYSLLNGHKWSKIVFNKPLRNWVLIKEQFAKKTAKDTVSRHGTVRGTTLKHWRWMTRNFWMIKEWILIYE